ncbi:hypothetical protein PENTCL1PPCAC_10796, partial [Pristionchus entomophagus]
RSMTHSDVLGRCLRAEENGHEAQKITNELSCSILLCLVAVLFCSQASAQYVGYAASPYYGYPAYGYGGYAGYGWGYPGYAAWWGSNKGGKGPERPAGPGPVGPSGLTGNQ